MIKAIFFDLDATLVNVKEEYPNYVFSTILSSLGYKSTREDSQNFWFYENRNQFLAKKGIDIEEFWAKFHEIDTAEQRAKNTYAYSDALNILEKIKGKYKTAIITHSPKEKAEKSSEYLNFNFDIILSGYDYELKPSPKMVNAAIEYLKISPQEIIMVGDDINDMLAAQSAGVKGIMIDRGLKNFDYFPKIKSLEELMKYL
jgi:HAD superfamily hydrolase (TIGR01549 family)